MNQQNVASLSLTSKLKTLQILSCRVGWELVPPRQLEEVGPGGFLIDTDVLQTHWSKPLDTQQASCMNPKAKKGWFELVKKFVVNLGIKPENLYGMDESGCPASDQGTRKVVGGCGTKTQHKQGGADRENVTAIITICADGTALHPTIIFKAAQWNPEWRENNVLGAL